MAFRGYKDIVISTNLFYSQSLFLFKLMALNLFVIVIEDEDST